MIVLFALGVSSAACSTTTAGPWSDTGTPVFLLAGQSNAEGAVNLAGLERVAAALPDGDNPLTAEQRDAARSAYQSALGESCETEDPVDSALADASIDALRAGSLDLSNLDESFTIEGAEIVAHRFDWIPGGEPLGNPVHDDDPAVPAWHRADPAPLGPGYGSVRPEDPLFGPELGMGLALARHLDEFSIVKVTMPGSALFEQWAPGEPLRAQLFTSTAGHLSERPDHDVSAFIWFQGFNDQFEEFSIRGYEDNMTSLIADVRAEYGADLPVVIVEARRPDDLPTLGEIADAQQKVAARVPNVALVESAGLSNCFHYDAVSQIVIGERVANALLEIAKR